MLTKGGVQKSDNFCGNHKWMVPKDEPSCLWFTFDAINGTCSQFDTESCNVTQCKACVTGQTECAFSQVCEFALSSHNNDVPISYD